jgi:hypothetical protein
MLAKKRWRLPGKSSIYRTVQARDIAERNFQKQVFVGRMRLTNTCFWLISLMI